MRKIYVSNGLIQRATTRRFRIDGKIQPRVKSTKCMERKSKIIVDIKI